MQQCFFLTNAFFIVVIKAIDRGEKDGGGGGGSKTILYHASGPRGEGKPIYM